MSLLELAEPARGIQSAEAEHWLCRRSVLVVSDNRKLVRQIETALEGAAFDVVETSGSAGALAIARDHLPDIILLEATERLELCKRLRSDSRTSRLPIIMLGEAASELDCVLGLEMGSDDYVTTPLSVRELVARIKAVLRRSSGVMCEQVRVDVGALSIDIEGHQVSFAGRTVPVTPTEYRILTHLAGRPGRVVSRDEILNAAFPVNTAVTDRTVDVHIAALRKKFGDGASYFQTIRGFGYKFGKP